MRAYFLYEYEAKFSELSRYAPKVVGAEEDLAIKFQEGLALHIKKSIAPLMIKKLCRSLLESPSSRTHS